MGKFIESRGLASYSQVSLKRLAEPKLSTLSLAILLEPMVEPLPWSFFFPKSFPNTLLFDFSLDSPSSRVALVVLVTPVVAVKTLEPLKLCSEPCLLCPVYVDPAGRGVSPVEGGRTNLASSSPFVRCLSFRPSNPARGLDDPAEECESECG